MKVAVIIAILFCSACSWAQRLQDTTYRVEITTTASPMFNFFRLPKVPGTENKTSIGYSISMRLLWHPGRLLSIGLLTGYCVLAEDEINGGGPNPAPAYHARLAAVPLLLALTMQKYDFELGMGVGPYLMMTSLHGGHSETVNASRLELGMTFFGAYMFALSDTFSIAPELRVVSFRYRGIVSIMPSCSFRYIPLRY